jgi:hypothetical protein
MYMVALPRSSDSFVAVPEFTLFGFFAAINYPHAIVKVMLNSKQDCKKKAVVLSFRDEK